VADEIVRLYSMAPWQTVLIKPVGDKVSRMNAVAHLFSGDVRRGPETTDPITGTKVPGIDVWSGDDVRSRQGLRSDGDRPGCVVPGGAHDDVADAMSQLMAWVRKYGVVVRKVEWEAADIERRTFRKEPGVPYAQGL